MEISGKGLFQFYEQPSSLIGNQSNHRCQVLLIQLYESDYECICILIYGKIRNVPLNILYISSRVVKIAFSLVLRTHEKYYFFHHTQ